MSLDLGFLWNSEGIKSFEEQGGISTLSPSGKFIATQSTEASIYRLCSLLRRGQASTS